jgi:xylulokinase
MKALILGIDIGTSAVKAAAFDTAGNCVSASAVEYDLEKPAPGIVELDPEIYWRSVVSAVRKVLSETASGSIVSIGVTSQGETFIPLDASGRPVRKAVVWLDSRASEEADEITARFGAQTVYGKSGQTSAGSSWAALIRWLQKHEPETLKKSVKFLLPEDYIIHRLTGEFATCRGLVTSTLLYDIKKGCVWKEMLDFLGVSADKLPRLLEAGEIAGNVRDSETGLPKGVPVCAAPIDQVAGAVGAGNIRPGMVSETTGTALAVCVTTENADGDPQRRVCLFNHADRDLYVLLPWAPASGVMLRWFRDALAPGMSFEAMSAAAAKISPGSDGLWVMPHFAGAVCPDLNPSARGAFLGLTLAHGAGHIVRAMMESVAYLLRDNTEAAGTLCDNVFSLGGGAKSDVWLQIKADVLNRNISTLECAETPSLGAAALAAVPAGVFGSPGEAVKSMVRVKKTFTPSPVSADIYEGLFQKYKKLNAACLRMSREDKNVFC